jgi:hypothetical protein
MNLLSNFLYLMPKLLLLGYLGPETVMPIASIIATIIGAILIFWRFIWGTLKKIFKKGQSADNENIDELDITSDAEEFKDEIHSP